MNLFERIGIDYHLDKAEDAVTHAGKNNVRFIDICIDYGPNALETFDDARCAKLKELCAANKVQLGLHTLSAVNVAEFSPFMRDAVDQYLRAYIDIASKVGAKWIIVHGGYRFNTDVKLRMKASVERLKRAIGYAETKGVNLLLENLNGEPKLAEVHYLASPLDEMNWYFDQLQSPNLGWSFTINHASYEPENIEGFIKGLPMHRLGEVRLADNNGLYEIHMYPGEGVIDFGKTFALIEASGYKGHYCSCWGTPADMLRGRDYLINEAKKAGVNVN